MNDREMNGKVISEIFYEELREFVNKTDKHPKIVDISIGDDFASKKYVNIKILYINKMFYLIED